MLATVEVDGVPAGEAIEIDQSFEMVEADESEFGMIELRPEKYYRMFHTGRGTTLLRALLDWIQESFQDT